MSIDTAAKHSACGTSGLNNLAKAFDMPSSSVRSFTDPADYGAAVRAATSEVIVTTRGRFAAKLTRIDLHDLWMQRFSENLPRVAHSVAGMGRAIISFRARPGPGMSWNGKEMPLSTIMRHSEGYDAFQRSSGLASWGAMSLRVERMASASAAISGCDLTPPRDTLSVMPPPSALAKLRRLHAAAGYLAEDAPEVIAHPEAARGLEQALIQAMVACLDTSRPAEDTSARRRHETIMRRFHAAIAEHPGEAVYIPDVCAAVGVPQRTLNLCCHESLGIGPKRYLLLRRMNLARQALRKADAAATTVTDVAADFGFWSFGRFAVAYKALFDEMPSTTLHGPSP
jgi:AraC-like DNA-binding protein